MKPEFTAHTLAVWQPRTSRVLTPEDARQIVENMVGFFRTLREWAEAEKASSRRSHLAQPRGSPDCKENVSAIAR